MLKIITHSRFVDVVEYNLAFDFEGEYNHGFSFPCTKDGTVDVAKLPVAARDSYQRCLTGEIACTGGRTLKLEKPRVRKHEHSYREPAVGRCVCGAKVVLDGFTNTCDRCERDYNSAGQELAPRSQWGEETGETLGEILAIS